MNDENIFCDNALILVEITNIWRFQDIVKTDCLTVVKSWVFLSKIRSYWLFFMFYLYTILLNVGNNVANDYLRFCNQTFFLW